MVSREDVFEAINSEREYQDSLWVPEDYGGIHSVTEFLLYMDDYLAEAKHIVSREAGPACDHMALEIIRKVVSMGVSCMEQHGAPKRFIEGGDMAEARSAHKCLNGGAS